MPEGIDAGFAYNPGPAGARRAEISRLFAERLADTVEGNAAYIYEWDEQNRERKRNKHGVDFAAMLYFDWEAAPEPKKWWEAKAGEWRWETEGYISDTLHRVAYTERDGRMRIITLFPLDDENELH